MKSPVAPECLDAPRAESTVSKAVTASGRPAASDGVQDTVLVGFAEALAAPEVVWSLVDDGFDVVAFTRRGRASGLRHSRHVRIYEIHPPESDVAAALSDLRDLLNSPSIGTGASRRLLFPLDDTAVWLCSQVELHGDWLLAGPQGPMSELALNKREQIKLAREAGFNVPKTCFAESAKEVAEFCKSESFPVILKAAECVPVRGNRIIGSRKWICANLEELQRALAEWGERVPLLVQPFVMGVGEGMFGIATDNGIEALSAHKRLRMMNPQGSGASACVSQPVANDLRSIVGNLIGHCGWRGLFMVEVLRDTSGAVWFVEINGRPWGSMALARRQGFEYPAWSARLTLDHSFHIPPSGRFKPGMVCRHLGRDLMHILFVLRGPKSAALKSWPPFWKTLGQVFSFGREDAFYNWRKGDLKVFLADCYYTIHGNLFKSRS